MKKRSLEMACALILGLSSCKPQKSEQASSERPKTAPSAAPPKTAVLTDEDQRGEAGVRKMANCPSTVEGAATAIASTPEAVILTITAKLEPAVKEIRERAKHLVEIAPKDPASIKHTGEGEGGGGLGNCPIVLAGTTIASEEVSGGVKITVKPNKPDDLDKVVQAAKERNAKLPETEEAPSGTAK